MTSEIAIRTTQTRPLVLHTAAGEGACIHCSARPESVCHVIDDGDLRRLALASTASSAAPGTSFIDEGEPAEAFFNITAGTAKLYKLLPDGRRQITGFARRGDFLGLAGSEAYAFSAEAVDWVRFCRFSRRKLEALLVDFPVLERQILRVASNELVKAQDQMLLLGRKTACERVATFLLSHEERVSPCGELAGTVALPMTRGDIADYLGLTLETVSRTLNRLKREGLIALPSLTIARLIEREALQAIAEGSTAL